MSNGNVRRVLVVEPDRHWRDNLIRAIGKGLPGTEIITAEDGTDALRIARAERVDLLITALALPEREEGLSLIKQLKAGRETSQMPIVVVSGVSHGPTVEEAIKLVGKDRYVPKPWLSSVLIRCVRRTLGV
ncbi:MAG: response regulator [bacterium]|nr:response regulator [bacterium]